LSDTKRNTPGADGQQPRKAVRLKDVAEYLDLSPATVSLVLNRSPVAKSIPRETHERVLAAVEKLGYRPNLLARSLRKQKTNSIGVLVPEISEGYAAEVMQGVETHLRKAGYFYLLASHSSKKEVLEEYLNLLQDRLVEGLILLAAQLEKPLGLPTISISGHRELAGVANITLDENLGAELALEHLTALGHERIAFFRGPPHNADAPFRWRAIERVAETMAVEIRPQLVLETAGITYGEAFYREGYARGRELLETGVDFTALFAFNDMSAIGAIRAFLDQGLRVPEEISVVGFDDIESAQFVNPSLTTIRQPLRRMGETAAKVLLETLSGADLPAQIMIEPRLIVRDSTGPRTTPT
jgi:LacI family transcriptional regulator